MKNTGVVEAPREGIAERFSFPPAEHAGGNMILQARALKALTIVFTAALGSVTAQAQTGDFYKGKTIKIVLPTAPGGSTSLY